MYWVLPSKYFRETERKDMNNYQIVYFLFLFGLSLLTTAQLSRRQEREGKTLDWVQLVSYVGIIILFFIFPVTPKFLFFTLLLFIASLLFEVLEFVKVEKDLINLISLVFHVLLVILTLALVTGVW